MMDPVRPQDAARIERDSQYGRYVMHDYLGSHASADSETGYQAYLVEQHAPVLGAHFHEVDQFQVVVGGSGRIGRDAVRPGVVHYADHHTVYGPLEHDGEPPLAYFTLRIDPTTGLNRMPEDRAAREPTPGEHFVAAVEETSAGAGEVAVLATTSAGAWAGQLRLESGQAVASTWSGGPGFALVMRGEVDHAGVRCAARTVLPYRRPEELAGLVGRGDDGALVALTGFAPRAVGA